MVGVEVEADMERVLDHFNLILQRGAASAAGDRPCGSGRSSGSEEGGGSPGRAKEAAVAVKERIARALRLYKDAAGEGEGGGGWLVQVWVPARDGGRRVLATRGQPFVLASQCHRLFQYRAVSLTRVFPVGGAAAADEQGLPARAFDMGAPEWTPNVQCYGSGEYARISYALIYDIQGSLALPILDTDTDIASCLAVLELVTTAPLLRVSCEVANLCNALQAVSLRGVGICNPAAEIINPDATQAAMAEVSELLTTVCEAHRLPLAQAWIRCRSCSGDALTTAGAPFHLAAVADVRGFRDACVEHHLRHGQGLVGGTAATAGASAAARAPGGFCGDVARCSKDAYPLAHYARMYGLAGCLVLRAELNAAAMADAAGGGGDEEECVVLELFLPPDCTGVAEQKAAVDAITATINACSGNLKAIVISNLEDLFLDTVADGDQQIRHEMDDLGDDQRSSDEDDLQLAVENTNIGELKIHSADQIRGEDHRSQVGKNKTRRGKTEKSVTLDELQKYFSGSLKDAARSLGVCPTTMKRICRQHGIPRWPFRKISKVNRSLDKMKRVMESANCSPSPAVAMPAHPALLPPPLPAAAPPPPPRPCLSSTLGEASSHGSCQAPPHAKAALQKPSQCGNGDGVVTIKASYRGDIVRFRVPCSAGVAAVKAEVAKRLRLDSGAFDVKYLDDDHEWVLLSCDADFQECLDVVPALSSMSAAAKSGSGAAVQVVRLMVQEVADNIGSSCASSD